MPTWDTGAATGFGSEEIAAAAEEGSPSASWETRFGYRVDMMAAFAYILGPISGMLLDTVSEEDVADLLAKAFLLLILETQNDYVRFHGTYRRRSLMLDHCLIVTVSLPISTVYHTSHSSTHHGHHTWVLGLAEVSPDAGVRYTTTFHGVCPDPVRFVSESPHIYTADIKHSSTHREMALRAIIYPLSATLQNSGCRTSSYLCDISLFSALAPHLQRIFRTLHNLIALFGNLFSLTLWLMLCKARLSQNLNSTIHMVHTLLGKRPVCSALDLTAVLGLCPQTFL